MTLQVGVSSIHAHILFTVHGFHGSAQINLKKSHERLPRGSRQATQQQEHQRGTAAADKTGRSPRTQRGIGLQPMNTKHGEATGKLTNRFKCAYFNN